MATEILEMEARLKDFISGNIDKIEKSINQFGKESDTSFKKASKGASTFMDTVKGFVTAQAIIGATRKAFGMLTSYVKESVEAYKEEEKANALLTEQLGYTSDAIKKQASELQKVTTFGDEATVMAAAQVAAFVKDEQAIQRLLPVIQDLAVGAFKGELEPAAALVAKTMGSSTNALSRYGIEVKGAVGSSERLESIINGVSKAYEGQAQALGKTDLGKLQIQNNLLSDQQETLGKQVIPFQIQWNSLLIELGNKVLPPLTSAMEAYNKVLGYNRDIAKDQANQSSLAVWAQDAKKLREEITQLEVQQKAASSDEMNVLGGLFTEDGLKRLRVAKEELKIVEDQISKSTPSAGGTKTTGGGGPTQGDLIDKNKEVSDWLINNAGATQAALNKMNQEGFDYAKKLMEEQAADEISSVEYQNEVVAQLHNARLDQAMQARELDYEDQKTINEKKLADDLLAEEKRKSIQSAAINGAITVSNAVGNAIQSQLMARAKSDKEQKEAAKKSAIISWQMGMGGAAASVWTSPGGTWVSKLIELGAIQAALTTEFGVQMSQINKAARGADFETRGKQLLMVGDNPGGRERVSVTPTSSSNFNGPSGGGSVSIDNSVNIPAGAYVDRSAGEMIVAEQRRQGRRLERMLNNGYLEQFVSDAMAR